MSHTGSGQSPEASAGQCFITQTSGWVGSKKPSQTAFFFKSFAEPDVSEHASQLLSVQLTNSLFAQEALL